MTGTKPGTDPLRRLVPAAVGGLGLSAMMTQLALVRELLGAFSGNELVLGISLGGWLLLTGAGTWLGRFTRGWSARALAAGLTGIALLPLAQVVAVRVLRDVVFMRGAEAGVIGTTAGCMALLLPYCLLSGTMLTLACSLPTGGRPGIGRVYIADTAGGIAGGVLFTFALVPWFDHFALLCFPALLNLLLAGLLAWRLGSRVLASAAAACAAALAGLVCLVDVDALSTALQYPGRAVVLRASSPYGRLVVTESSGQFDFFENGAPVLSSRMIEQVEETVHYAMCQRPDARRVLLISGGVAGSALEILRYPGVREVTCVELDPRIVEAGRRFLPGRLDDPRIRIVMTDGRRFVQRTDGRFDVVIAAVPDPSTLQLNRFYTAEFFAEVKRVLAPGGVLGFGLGQYENHVSRELAELLSSARRTAGGSFANVRLIPGGRVFFLASDGPLTPDIASRLEQRGLSLQWVRRSYLDAMLAPDRLADLDRAIAQPAAVNTDFNPVLYYYQLRHWLSRFSFDGGLLGGGLLVLLAAYLWRLRAVPRVVFASGFAASALEVVLLLAYQGLYGSLYRQVGLVVTVFMAGLTAGAWLANRRAGAGDPVRGLGFLSVAVAVFSALLPAALLLIGGGAAAGSPAGGQGAILAMTLLLAALVGGQFPLAGAASPAGDARTASRLYTADLAGASLGALLAGALLVPLLGVTAVCLLTAGLNLAAAGLLYHRSSNA